MNRMIELFEQVLVKFRFKEPLDPEAQAFILSYKFQGLAATLRRYNQYSVAYGLVLRVFFFFKRRGFSISVRLSKVIAAIAPLLVLIVIAHLVWIFYSFTYSISARDAMRNLSLSPRATDAVASAPVKEKPGADAIKKTVLAPVIRYRLGVGNFSGAGIDPGTLAIARDAVAGHIVRIKGNGFAVNLARRSDVKKQNVGLLLFGSIERLGDTVIITAKVIDVEKSTIMAVATERCASADALSQSMKTVAEKIAGRIH